MNWGKSIVLVFVLFAGFIGTLVYKMINQRVDLVSENYYQNEIEYQKQIDRVSNAKSDTSVRITYQPVEGQVVVAMPKSIQKGEVKFYRPGDRRQDFQVAISSDNNVNKVISTKSLAKGNWRVQFSWSDGQREFYKEEQFYL